MNANLRFVRNLFFSVAVAALQLSTTARAAQPIELELAPRAMRTLRFNAPIDKVRVGSPRVATVRLVGTHLLEVVGHTPGQTVVRVISRGGGTSRVIVSVALPTGGLAARLRAIFPTESIVSQKVGNSIVLTGMVSDPLVAQRVEQVVKAFLGAKGKSGGDVLNHLQIRGRQQVQVRVKIAEVSRTAARELGVNIWQRGNQYAGGIVSSSPPLGAGFAAETPAALQPGAGNTIDDGGRAALPLLAGPRQAVSSIFGLHFATAGALPLSVALNIMQSRGLAKVLSEPTLVAYSGHKANFLAGGEFPIPLTQALGQTSVEFKKFGVQLEFLPTVLSGQTVHMKVSVSVSEPDTDRALTVGGANIPSFATRHGQTTIRMRSGQSFAIAGLLQDRVDSVTSKVPLLGDIPVIGMLFRQQSFRRTERELVILVTPHLVRPLRPGEVPPLPGEDEISDPGAWAFFLLGSVDPQLKDDKKAAGGSSGRRGKSRTRSGPAGPLGFSP